MKLWHVDLLWLVGIAIALGVAWPALNLFRGQSDAGGLVAVSLPLGPLAVATGIFAALLIITAWWVLRTRIGRVDGAR